MNVALVLAPSYNPNTPPLSLAYLKAYIQRDGVNVKCFDLNIDLYSKIDSQHKNLWEGAGLVSWIDEKRFDSLRFIDDELIDQWVSQIMAFDPQIIGFSIYNTNYRFSSRIAKKIKELNKDIFVLYGGPEIFMYRYNFEVEHLKFVDCIVFGEGEEAARKIIQSVKENGFIVPTPGALVRVGNYFAGDDRGALIKDLDSIPFPDYDDFDFSKYKERGQLAFVFSRGCIGRCTFCFETVFWQRYRHRSLKNIFKELKYLLNRYGEDIFNFSFNDSLINGDLGLLREFCDSVIRRKIKIGWWGMARIDSRMDKRFIKKMIKAGCRSLSYGIESGSQKVLDLMRKRYSLEDIEKTIMHTYGAGIRPGISLLVGFPGEEEDDFQKTCELVKRIGKYLSYVNISSLGIIPCTPIYNNRYELGIYANIKDLSDWYGFDGKNTLSIRVDRMNRLREITDKHVVRGGLGVKNERE